MTKSLIFVSTGEPSGDLLGAKLLAPLAAEYQIEGILGPEMRRAGFSEVAPMETLQIMGFSAVVLRLPKIILFFLRMKRHILRTNPAVVVLIDSPDFHLPLARMLRRSGFRGKVVQVVCPSIWAWRGGRKKTLENHFDLLFTLFPFEEKLFRDSPMEALYLGHPLIEELVPQMTPAPPREKLIALFPGSRRAEILRHLPVQLAATRAWSGYRRAISVSNPAHLPLIVSLTKNEPIPPLLVPKEHRHQLMRKAEFALAKLGTITLELALLEVPTLTHFTVPLPEKLLLQHLFRVQLPYYALPNIIAQQEIFPEYLFPRNTLEELKEGCRLLVEDGQERERVRERCQEMKRILQVPPSVQIFSEKIRMVTSI
jgi:lipid-A-disaccharide synthase